LEHARDEGMKFPRRSSGGFVEVRAAAPAPIIFLANEPIARA
jgi:hypothetical protein